MRQALSTVVSNVLDTKDQLTFYTDNIALDARKVQPNEFIGLACRAYYSGKQSKTYRDNNFFCELRATPVDLAGQQVRILLLLLVVVGCCHTLYSLQ